MPATSITNSRLVARRQLAMISVFLLIFGLASIVLFIKDRQREWRLRAEQSDHRLGLAFELITRDLERVCSDVLNLARQRSVEGFEPGNPASRKVIETEFGTFLSIKQTYQQLRLLDLNGQEQVRVDLPDANIKVVPESELQDKNDRYYFRESLGLDVGDVFVSKFDLNQEHGLIEQPLNPVVRFATPAKDESDRIHTLLIANYRGTPLLDDLSAISLPGKTFVIRADGQYLLGPNRNDAWGWLLDHPRNFATQFPDAWSRIQMLKNGCHLTSEGAFEIREIEMERFGKSRRLNQRDDDMLLLVSFLPATDVFATSNQLLNRLLMIAAIMMLPLIVLTRFWAVASVRRQQQNLLILESEKKLRELSSRLVRLQEEERRAISREIHDQLGQQVTAINLDLKLAQRDAASAEAKKQLQRAIDDSEQLLDSLHRFATRIRPVELDDLGLHDAVESHLWEFKDRTAIDFKFDSNVESTTLPQVISENVYRLIQESLNNVLKHADATMVNVSIFRMAAPNQNGHPGEGLLQVVVEDDGIGAPGTLGNPTDKSEGMPGNSRLGILGMQERVDLLGGTFSLVAGSEKGTKVEVTVPIDELVDDACSESHPMKKD